jgi:hypothetical protein
VRPLARLKPFLLTRADTSRRLSAAGILSRFPPLPWAWVQFALFPNSHALRALALCSLGSDQPLEEKFLCAIAVGQHYDIYIGTEDNRCKAVTVSLLLLYGEDSDSRITIVHYLFIYRDGRYKRTKCCRVQAEQATLTSRVL